MNPVAKRSVKVAAVTAQMERSTSPKGTPSDHRISSVPVIDPFSTPAAPRAPDDVVALAEQRAIARLARDWSAADELKERIEAAGWRIVDAGADFTLVPERAPDIFVGERTLYGHPETVPSALDTPATSAATVIVVADGVADTLAAVGVTMAAIAAEAPEGTQRIVVLDGTDAGGTDDATAPALMADEIVWTASRFGPGAALQAGARRATGAIVIALALDRIPSGDFVTPLVAALYDPAVGVAGSTGLRSTDLHHFERTPSGAVTAMAAECIAFRRQDLIDRGPLDDRVRLADSVAIWWSLVLRDEGEHAPPRTALAIDLPLGTVADADADRTAPRDRRHRRDSYRISDRFGGRDDLVG